MSGKTKAEATYNAVRATFVAGIEYEWRAEDLHLEARSTDYGLELTVGCMYDAPKISVESLEKLTDIFGTKKIDVDNYARSGCETCDWGSDYGHTLQVYSPTRGTEILKHAKEPRP